MKPSAGAFAHVAREAMVERFAASDAGPTRSGYVPAAARAVPDAISFVLAVIAEKRLNATVVPAPSEKALAVIVLFARRFSVAVPAAPLTPNVSEATVWLLLASTRRPPPATVRSVPVGSAPAEASSQTAPFSMTVGPSQYWGAVNRKPEFLAVFMVRIVMPCDTSSGCVFVAVYEQATTSTLLAVAPVPVRKMAPCVPMRAELRSARMYPVWPSARCSAMPPSKSTFTSQPSPMPFWRRLFVRKMPPSSTLRFTVTLVRLPVMLKSVTSNVPFVQTVTSAWRGAVRSPCDWLPNTMPEPDVLQALQTYSLPPSTKMRASEPGSSQKPTRL